MRLIIILSASMLLLSCATPSSVSVDLVAPAIQVIGPELTSYLTLDELMPQDQKLIHQSALMTVSAALTAGETIDVRAYGPQLRDVAQTYQAYVASDSKLDEFSKRTRSRTSELLLRLVAEAGG